MHLLPEAQLSLALRQMNREQCCEFLSRLSNSLATLALETQTAPSERLIHQPLRTHIVTKDQNVSLFMPVSNTTNTGIKIVTVPNTSSIAGVINIFSPEGKLIGLLSAAEVTAFRTALATMTLFLRCSSFSKERIVIFGCGKQAEWHARLALLLLAGALGAENSQQPKMITFINRGRRRLEQFNKEVLQAQLKPLYPQIDMDILAKEGTQDYEERLSAALCSTDVIFSCTPSTEPNFTFNQLRTPTEDHGFGTEAHPRSKQRFISLIGSYKPNMQEVDSETLLSGGGLVYVDSRDACLEEAGELIKARVTAHQLIELGEIFNELGETESLNVPDDCNVIFKCVGMGIMDLVIGKGLLELASEQGLGIHIDGF